MDCWDGTHGEPEIYHGHTMTSRINFRDVLEVIREYAFAVSPYPLILSIELHCGIPQQQKMVQYFKEILGGTQIGLVCF